MAAQLSWGQGAPVAHWFWRALKLAAGVVLLATSLFLLVSLWGYEPTDPSWNRVGGTEVANPGGLIGAKLADMGKQLFGHAIWLLPITLLSWGVRLLLGRDLSWPWLPVAALPLALMALAAALAQMTVDASSVWHFRTGFGGLVGDLIYHGAPEIIGQTLYFWLALIFAFLFALAALGLRIDETLQSALGLSGHAGRFGRQLGDVARDASAASGRWASEQLERRRPATSERSRASFDPPDEDNSNAENWIFGQSAPSSESEADNAIVANAADDSIDAPVTARRPTPKRSKDQQNVGAKTRSKADAARALQPDLPLDRFVLPDSDMLTPVRHASGSQMSKPALAENSSQLEAVLGDFGVRGSIIDAKPGPVVTLYELEPAPGTRAQRIVSLADDIARSLSAMSVRVATVPGRNVIGIELPNDKRQIVFLRELLEHEVFAASEARLALALGKDISGRSIIVDLARMPHLLIAGTTGSGKSVAINAMILSLLLKLTPDQCRIIMIDPKVIELSVYEDIPHLLAPVVTEPHKAVVALKWVVRQMDERYRLMSHLGVRDIFAYNRRIEQARARGQELTRTVRTGFEPGTGQPVMEEQPIDMTPLPLIVVIVDEVADLMLTAGKEIENCIQRLSQKARAAGIHLIVATQRPSVDVLTGVIKANLPSRISFRVSSKIDSRTILGEAGAEQLLGQGDMLYMMPGDRIIRVHGPLVSDQDVEKVVAHLRTMGEPEYDEAVTAESFDDSPGGVVGDFPTSEGGGNDGLYNQAVQIVARDGKASTSYLQRKLSIGYNSAAKLIERMEAEGLISHADHVGRRQVLMGRGGIDGNEPTSTDDG